MSRSLSLCLFLCPALLLAGPTIAPTGHELYLTMGPSNTANVVNNGGRFDGRLGTNPVNANNPLVNLWCVDAQLYFNWNTPYRANSLSFSEINGESGAGNNWAGGSRDVRYEDVLAPDTNPATPNFRHATGFTPPSAPGAEALFRYRMAAYLLDQYSASSATGATTELTGSDVGVGKYAPVNSTRNQAIIGAIWAAMDTNTDSDDRAVPSGNIATWFNRAASYVNTNWNNSALWSKWVVVSAWAGSAYVQNGGNTVQTFLSEVPEPGFYGALAIGLSALYAAASRRRARQNAQV